MNYALYIMNYICWNPDQIIFQLGPMAVRWYSTCWLIGLVAAYLLGVYLFKKQGYSRDKYESLFLYCFVGILFGARLGHCLFYEPGYFLSSGTHIIEMFLPMRYGIDGAWHFTGYEGLASHGGTIGLMLALFTYGRVKKIPMLRLFDIICVFTPITACFIRLGNLMNSEIVGIETTVPWGFIFEKLGPEFQTPHHPSQLYEAIAYALFFPVMWYFWRRRPDRMGTGFFFGLCLTLIFTFRFFIEYTKEVQEAFEASLPIDMGQILSIPFIIIGIIFIHRGMKHQGNPPMYTK